MTKPFEPHKPVLFYMADDHLDEDVYMSNGRYRRYWSECNRINRPGNRKHLKFIKMMCKKVGLTPSSIQTMREKAKEVF